MKTSTILTKYLPINFDKRLFLWLVLSFIIATVVGTITHELGHWIVAKLLGFNVRINYQSTLFLKSDKVMNINDTVLILLGGPLQTMLTGTAGLLLMFYFRKSFHETERLTFGLWTLVFITLLWLRQTANFFVWIVSTIVFGHHFSHGDEIRLTRYFQIPEWTIISGTALIGLAVLSVVIFKFIPVKHRLTFILSGIIGGVAGYMIWLESLGEFIMP